MRTTRKTRAMRVGMILAATALALPALAGTASAAPPLPGGADCASLASQLNQALAQVSSASSAIAALGNLPVPAALLQQLQNGQAQVTSLYQQLSSQLCSSLPGGSGGGGTVVESSLAGYDGYTPVRYGTSHRNYGYDDYDANAPVIVNQVGAVPRGGVATGDGSFGE